MKDDDWAGLVPELDCSDLSKSLEFYTDALGFSISFERREDGFACIALARAIIMLEQSNGNWSTGILQHPYGRGLNFQIEVEDAGTLCEQVQAAGHSLFRNLQTSWYRQNDVENGQTEFLVQDPDGYLLRFSQYLGTRPIQTDGD